MQIHTSNIMMLLFGGGFAAGLMQLSMFYYAVAFVLHTVVPAVMRPRSLQQEQRVEGAVWRDAVNSLPPILVKAGIWRIVELLHAQGYGQMYDELPR